MKLSLGAKISIPILVLGFFIIGLPLFNHWQFQKVNRSLAGGALRVQMLKAARDHHEWMGKVIDAILKPGNTRIEVQTDPERCGFGQWYHSADRQEVAQDYPAVAGLLDSLEQPHEALHRQVVQLEKLLAADDKQGALAHYQKQVQPKARQLVTTFDQISEKVMSEALDEKELASLVDTYQNLSIWLGLILGLGGAGAMLFISRRIMADLNATIRSLMEASGFIAKQGRTFSTSSEEIAAGAGNQAASLEETSATLEEIASMTARNAENAHQANSLMQTNQQTVGEADAAMKEMAVSMADITQSGQETRKIVKTIDEIAFQTNLLALNAAVEAARAGEAGMGFAVVAEEVRNLAMRAAEAAKNTATLIDETGKKIEDGSALVHRTEQAFASVTEGAGKVAALVAEIAGASQEQSNGLNQLNQTVSSMDRVVQANAGHAESNSAMAKDLEKEAANLEQIVQQLVDLVGSEAAQNRRVAAGDKEPRQQQESGKIGREGETQGRQVKLPAPGKKSPQPGAAGKAGEREQVKSGPDPRPKASPKLAAAPRPEEVIPFDDGDFEDF